MTRKTNGVDSFKFRKIRQKPRAHPLVRELIDIMNQQGVAVGEVCAEAGIARNTFTLWGKTQSPRIDTLDASGQVCGFKLAWVPIDEETIYHKRRQYLAKSPRGELFQITNLREFCRNQDITLRHARLVVAGKAKHCKGWAIKHIDDPTDPTVIQERRAKLRGYDNR